jgi:hypothetical protein
LVVRVAPALLVLACLGACGDDYVDFDASTAHDLGSDDEGVPSEGGVPLRAVFTVTGCDKLEFDAESHPQCTAPRQRPLTFVPLGVGVSTVVWSFPGGAPSSSTLLTPEASWAQLGDYTVSLAAGGGGGTALGSGIIHIVPGGSGSACTGDQDCDSAAGLSCLCGEGSGCPAQLASGVCVRRCETASCQAGEACVDLARGGVAPGDGGVNGGDGGATDAFRVRACLRTCASTSSCRAGLACLELPSVSAGAPLAAPYTWVKACFAPVLGEVGASCAAPDGSLDDSRCLTGHCQPLGARGVCTDACDDGSPCPSTAVCAMLPSTGPLCLRRCTAGEDCGDPLTACSGPGAGGLGYALPPGEPMSTLLCAEKRCSLPADCAPAGTCSNLGGASFCVK